MNEDNDTTLPTMTNVFYAVDVGSDDRAKRLIHELDTYTLYRLRETAFHLLAYTEAEQRTREQTTAQFFGLEDSAAS